MATVIARDQLLTELTAHPWAVQAEALSGLTDRIAAMPATSWFDAPTLDAQGLPLAAIGRAPAAGGPVAVIPISGFITPRTNLFTLFFGGTGLDALMRDVRAAVADPSVQAVVLDVSSPGGVVYGVEEAATEIRSLRSKKSITAVAAPLAASAAYWLAASAGELVVQPSGEVGSVGVLSYHVDASAAYERMGVKVTLITAGKYKAEGDNTAPLSDEARAFAQKRVDEYYTAFVHGLARARGVSVDVVRSDFGEGRVFGAAEAVQRKMADRIDTRDAVIARLGRGRIPQMSPPAPPPDEPEPDDEIEPAATVPQEGSVMATIQGDPNETTAATPPTMPTPAQPAVSSEQWAQMLARQAAAEAETARLKTELHTERVTAFLDAETARGVPQAVVNIARPLLMACDPAAPADITVGEGPSAAQVNLMDAIKHLVGTIAGLPSGMVTRAADDAQREHAARLEDQMTTSAREAVRRRGHVPRSEANGVTPAARR